MSVNPTETADRDLPISPRRPSLAEQARAKGTPVIRTGDELMDDELFADATEHEEFLAFVRESRRADHT